MPTSNKLYNEDIRSHQLQNVALPEKIRCRRCKDYKRETAYSKRALNNLKFACCQNRNVSIQGKENCIACSGGQVVELTCKMCNKTMGLEEFSKNQRRNAENAKCEVCVREQVEMAPGDVEEEKSDSDENYDSDDSFYGSYVPGTTQQASFSAPSTKATPVPGRSVWEEQARAGTASQTASTRASRHGMPSSGGADSAMSSTSRHTTASSVVTGKSGWAKVKAKKPEPVFAQLEEDSDEGPAAGDSDDEEEELICL